MIQSLSSGVYRNSTNLQTDLSWIIILHLDCIIDPIVPDGVIKGLLYLEWYSHEAIDEKVNVKLRSWKNILVLLLLSSLVLSGCQKGSSAQSGARSTEFVPRSVEAAICDGGNQIRAIQAVDQNTVRFELCSPDRTFPAKVGVTAFSIQDDSVLSETQGDPGKISNAANGTGPFKIALTSNNSLRLEKRSDYWGLPVRQRTITFSWQSDANQRLLNLSLRQIDGISAVQPDDVNSIRLDTYLKVAEAPVVSTVYVGMNNTIAPFDNLAVRQAFASAFNRQKITDDFFGPSAVIADQLIPLAFDSGRTSALRWYDYDAKQTASLLQQNGFDFTRSLTLTYDSTPNGLITRPNELAQEMAVELKDAGVTLELNPLSTEDFIRALKDGNLGLFFAAFKPDYPDPGSFFETFFFRDNPLIGKTDPAVVAEIFASRATNDPKSLQTSFDNINQWIKQQVPLIPLAYANEVYGFRAMVGSVIIGAFGENLPEMTTSNQSLNFLQSYAPATLWPVNLSQEDTLRISRLVFDSLTAFDLAELNIKPALADSWSSNTDFTEWTFLLRYDVSFDNGSLLDANDVVASFAAQADASDPNHRSDVDYDYFRRYFGSFMNQP